MNRFSQDPRLRLFDNDDEGPTLSKDYRSLNSSMAKEDDSLKNLSYWRQKDPSHSEEKSSPPSSSPSFIKAGLFLSAVLVVFGAGWVAYRFLMSSLEAPVTIYPQTQAWRVKPENPGGASFPHQDKTIYDRLSPKNDSQQEIQEALLPQTEEPIIPQSHANVAPIQAQNPYTAPLQPQQQGQQLPPHPSAAPQAYAPQPGTQPQAGSVVNEPAAYPYPPQPRPQQNEIVAPQAYTQETPLPQQGYPMQVTQQEQVVPMGQQAAQSSYGPVPPMAAPGPMVAQPQPIPAYPADIQNQAAQEFNDPFADDQTSIQQVMPLESAEEDMNELKIPPTSVPEALPPKTLDDLFTAPVPQTQKNPSKATTQQTLPKMQKGGIISSQTHRVQIGATFVDRQKAERSWKRFRSIHVDLLRRLGANLQSVPFSGKQRRYRLIVGPFRDGQETSVFCNELRNRGILCNTLVPGQ